MQQHVLKIRYVDYFITKHKHGKTSGLESSEDVIILQSDNTIHYIGCIIILLTLSSVLDIQLLM